MVVCGAGPTGLTVALTLARAGVSVLVLEKQDGLSAESRASTFHPPTLELLDELGVAAEVIERGLRAPRTQFRDRRKGPIATFDLGLLDGETEFPFRIQLEQSKLTPLLLDRLTDDQLAPVDVRFGHRVHAAEVRDDRAIVVVGTDDEIVEFDAPWCVIADGAHSAARDSLGIALDGEFYPERFLVVSVADELGDILGDVEYVNYVADPDEWLVLLRTPDHWRVLFPIDSDRGADEVLSAESVSRALNGLVDVPREWDVLATSLYEVSRRVASTMRLGPFLLAGDSAHQNSPLGGMGMNSGIQDAVSAGRRLAQVIDGGSDELLDDYNRLRREVAVGFVQADSHANWLALREPDPERRSALRSELAAIAADEEQHRARMRRTAMLDAVRSHL